MAKHDFKERMSYSLRDANSVSLEIVYEAEARAAVLLEQKEKAFLLKSDKKQAGLLASDPNYLQSLTYEEEIWVGYRNKTLKMEFQELARENHIVRSDGSYNHRAIADAMAQLGRTWLLQGAEQKNLHVKPLFTVDCPEVGQPVLHTLSIAEEYLGRRSAATLTFASRETKDRLVMLRKRLGKDTVIAQEDPEQARLYAAKLDAAHKAKEQKEQADKANKEKNLAEQKTQKSKEAELAEKIARLEAQIAAQDARKALITGTPSPLPDPSLTPILDSITTN